MQIKNTKRNYGLVAILLHWIVAFGFLAAYASVKYRHWFAQGGYSTTELNSDMISLYLHLSFGISVFVFVVLRIAWKFLDTTPDDVAAGSRFEHFAAHTMHRILYVFMLVMPVTGYMGTKLDTNFFFLFNIPGFKDTALYGLLVESMLGTSWDSFESVMDAIHKTGGAYILWVLIGIHAGAALYHHFVRKDDVLKRMITIPE